jgi:RNA binding exosome subunit
MGIHHVSCRVTASGVDNTKSIIDSLEWLAGDDAEIIVDKSTSYHGSVVYLISFKLTKNKPVKQFINRLIELDTSLISQTLAEKIDENNTLHLRFCLDSLIGGQILIINSTQKSVKCNIKIEVYPGQTAEGQINKILFLA